MFRNTDREGPRIPLVNQQISSLSTPNFLDFGRNELNIDGAIVEAFRLLGDIGEEQKYKHVQESYRKDRNRFISKHRSAWERHLPTNIFPLPDKLPPRLVYEIIDSVASSTSWQRYARETLELEINTAALRSCSRVLTKEQKESMLQFWIVNQDGYESEILRRLCDIFNDYQANRRTF